MKANYMRATMTSTCCGYGLDAEMQVEKDDGTIVYLHANYFGGENYSVAAKSVFEWLTNYEAEDPHVEFEKQYSSLRAAQRSPYYRGFKALSAFVDDYQKWCKTEGNEGPLKVENPDVAF